MEKVGCSLQQCTSTKRETLLLLLLLDLKPLASMCISENSMPKLADTWWCVFFTRI